MMYKTNNFGISRKVLSSKMFCGHCLILLGQPYGNACYPFNKKLNEGEILL